MSAAEGVFLEKGFRAATVAEIADRAAVTKRTLYKHFPSKLALFIHMFDAQLRSLEALLVEGTDTQALSASRFRQNHNALFEFTLRNEKFMRLYWMLDSNEFEGKIPEKLLLRLNALTRQLIGTTEKVVRKAVDSGVIVDVDPLLLVHLLSAINKGIFIHASKEKKIEIEDIHPRKLFDMLQVILDRGLFVNEKKTGG